MSVANRRGWSTTTAGLLAGLSAFQVCLASGAPWGRVAYGGQHEGRLPDKYRRVSAAAGATYAGAAVYLVSNIGTAPARRRVLSTLTGFMVLGAAVNLASRSPSERLLWTPVCALTAVSAWRARPRR